MVYNCINEVFFRNREYTKEHGQESTSRFTQIFRRFFKHIQSQSRDDSNARYSQSSSEKPTTLPIALQSSDEITAYELFHGFALSRSMMNEHLRELSMTLPIESLVSKAEDTVLADFVRHYLGGIEGLSTTQNLSGFSTFLLSINNGVYVDADAMEMTAPPRRVFETAVRDTNSTEKILLFLSYTEFESAWRDYLMEMFFGPKDVPGTTAYTHFHETLIALACLLDDDRFAIAFDVLLDCETPSHILDLAPPNTTTRAQLVFGCLRAKKLQQQIGLKTVAVLQDLMTLLNQE